MYVSLIIVSRCSSSHGLATLDIVPVDAVMDGHGHNYVMDNVIFDDVSSCMVGTVLLLLTGL